MIEGGTVPHIGGGHFGALAGDQRRLPRQGDVGQQAAVELPAQTQGPGNAVHVVFRHWHDAISRRRAEVVGTGQQQLFERLTALDGDAVVTEADQRREAVVETQIEQGGEPEIRVIADIVLGIVVVYAGGEQACGQCVHGPGQVAPVEIFVGVIIGMIETRMPQGRR